MVSVKEIMGHSTIATTMRYAHLAPKNLQDAISVLENIVRAKWGKWGNLWGNRNE